MKSSSLKSYTTFITDHLNELTPKQYVIFVETVLSRMPLTVIKSIIITNKKDQIEIGFRKVGNKCPFCEDSPGL